MCNRYAQIKGRKQIEAHFDATFVPQDLALRPRYNIAPTQTALVVIRQNGRVAKEMKWGLVPSWATDETVGGKLTNARAETVLEKPSFKSAFHHRRCLVVADSFYEWTKTVEKQPLRFLLKSEEPFAFAGLFEKWNSPDGAERETFTIITTEANEIVRPIHDRMPVILPREKYTGWLNPAERVEDLITLLRPYPAEEMKFYAVHPIVGKPSVDSPQCIEEYQREQRDLF